MSILTDDFAELVYKRIRDSLPAQREVYKCIKNKRPLDAETNRDRKTAFIRRRLKVNTKVAKDIAAYNDVASLNLLPDKQQAAESIQGNTNDFISICFLDLARAASRSVARVVSSAGMPLGSGFMISPALFITNQHVVKTEEDAAAVIIEFNYEQDFQQRELGKTSFTLAPDKFFLHSPQTDLDFSIVAVGDKIQGLLETDDIGFLPLFNNDDKHIRAMFVNCIEHPNGGFKQIVIRENQLIAKTPTTLIYNSDTENGSSGSPVFNDAWEVVALHHFGRPYRALLDPHEVEDLPAFGNEGIRISAIVEHLKTKIADLPSDVQKVLLAEALSFPFRHPSLMIAYKSRDSLSKPVSATPEQETLHGGKGAESDLAFNFTLPLQISVHTGRKGDIHL